MNQDFQKYFRLIILGLLIGSPHFALSFTDKCENIFIDYKIPSVRDLRRLVIQFESSQKQHAPISGVMGEKVLHQMERAIENAKFEDLVDFFEPETGLIPFLHHDPKLRRAVANALYNHPAKADERARFLKKIISENIEFDFFDEVIGINKDVLEFAEEDALREVGSFEKRKEFKTLGINENHDRWFSHHLVLIGTLESAHRLGVKTIVDLGCGTGRLGLLAGLLYPEIKFIGLDLYAPRIQAAQSAAKRWGFEERIQFRVQDLLNRTEAIPEAEFYFIYGPTTDIQINLQVVNRLQETLKNKQAVVSSHYDSTTRILSAQPWLYKLNSKDIPDKMLFTNIPLQDWIKYVGKK